MLTSLVAPISAPLPLLETEALIYLGEDVVGKFTAVLIHELEASTGSVKLDFYNGYISTAVYQDCRSGLLEDTTFKVEIKDQLYFNIKLTYCSPTVDITVSERTCCNLVTATYAC
jgi:hypothetical protein